MVDAHFYIKNNVGHLPTDKEDKYTDALLEDEYKERLTITKERSNSERERARKKSKSISMFLRQIL